MDAEQTLPAGTDAPVGGEGTTPALAVARIVALGVPAAGISRLNAKRPVEVVDEEDAGQPALAIVSTRLPAPELAGHIARLSEAFDCAVVVLAHPGGEAAAVAALRAGATTITTEGAEDTLAGVIDPSEAKPYLVGEMSSTTRADGSGLPPVGALLSDLTRPMWRATAGIAVISFPDLRRATGLLPPGVANLLERRIGGALRAVVAPLEGRVYRLDDDHMVAAVPHGDALRMGELGAQLAAAAGNFAAGPGRLVAGVGTSTPEDAIGTTDRIETARVTADAIAAQGGGALGADAFARDRATSAATSTVLAAVADVESRDPHGPGHGDRVAAIADRIAGELGLDVQQRDALRVAARLHQVGKATLSDEAVAGPEGLEGAALDEHRSHPERAARLLRPAAGDQVADAVASYRERHDGSGFPQGVAGDDIPLLARVLALADTLDVGERTPTEVLLELRESPAFDLGVVGAACRAHGIEEPAAGAAAG